MSRFDYLYGDYHSAPEVAVVATYQWWTCTVSREHLKLGPLTLCWLYLEGWRLEAFWLGGPPLFTIPPYPKA